MVPEIVRQAVQIKMTCRSECPLISEAEYMCACAMALKALQAPAELTVKLGQETRIEGLRKELTPYFQEKREACQEDPKLHRLLSLLVHSRVEGEITDEVWALAR